MNAAVHGPSNSLKPQMLDGGICAALLLGTFIAFLPAAWCGFVSLDDPDWVTENPYVLQGITAESIRWATTTSAIGYWHPLTWYSHILDVQLFGLHAAGHHLMNVLLHALAAVVLFLALRRMTGSRWRSAFVAALFAWHPLRVESVAWIAERKDVLSTLFLLLTLAAYTVYVQRRSVGAYLLVAVTFLLACMAKPMVVTAPCLMLLLDYWPLRRLRFAPGADQQPYSIPLRQAVLEKLPLLAISIAFGIVTLYAQRGAGAMVPLDVLPLSLRLSNAAVAYVEYLRMLLWPARLSVFYPHTVTTAGQSIDAWRTAAALAILVVLSFVAVLNVRRRPYLIVGWLWYLGTLVLVIGLIQVGSQALADRYTYVPTIGIIIALTWAAWEFLSTIRRGREVALAAASLILLVCMVLTWRQTSFWRDDFTLARRALDVHPRNYLAHDLLGNALLARGEVDAAEHHYREALEIRPMLPEANSNLGNILADRGDVAGAILHYERALVQSTPLVRHSILHNLALLLAGEGRLDEAIAHWNEALRLRPDSPAMHHALAVALTLRGDPTAAIQHLERAQAEGPEQLEVLVRLAWLLATHPQPQRRDPQRAIALARRAVEISNSREPIALDALAAAQASAGQFDQAVETARQAQALAERRGQQELARRIANRTDLYTCGESHTSGRLPGD